MVATRRRSSSSVHSRTDAAVPATTAARTCEPTLERQQGERGAEGVADDDRVGIRERRDDLEQVVDESGLRVPLAHRRRVRSPVATHVVRDDPHAGAHERIDHAGRLPAERDGTGESVHQHDGRIRVRSRDADVELEAVGGEQGRHGA